MRQYETDMEELVYDEYGDILNEKDKVILEKLNPIIYDEEQFRYLSVGEKVADAFKTGIELRKSLNGEQEHE